MTDTTVSETTPGPAQASSVLPSTPIGVDGPAVQRAIALIWREAALLDAKEYQAWEKLYADDGVYVVPVERETDDFDNVLNMIYDDRRLRAARVVRLVGGYSMSAVDAALTVRTVSRFVPQSAPGTAEAGTEVVLKAGQILIAYKRTVHDIWAADVDFTVRLGAAPADDRLVRKVVRLVDADGAVPAAGFLL